MSDAVTELLRRWRDGDDDALTELLPLVYGELRRLARRALRGERSSPTLQPTALVNEAFLKLVPQRTKDWQNREHFYAVCAQLMRQVLVDQARRRRAQKRPPPELRVELRDDDGKVSVTSEETVNLLDLDRVLEDLAAIDSRRTRVVEMRYFGGLTTAEIAVLLGVKEWDVKKDWMLAKAWLRRRLRAAG